MAKRKHLSNKELEQLLIEANERVPAGSKWRHFKGGDYRVLSVVFDSEDLQFEIVHESLDYPGVVFTRSMSNWLESVEFQGYTLPRFEMIEDK